jgi:hypothetical protein
MQRESDISYFLKRFINILAQDFYLINAKSFKELRDIEGSLLRGKRPEKLKLRRRRMQHKRDISYFLHRFTRRAAFRNDGAYIEVSDIMSKSARRSKSQQTKVFVPKCKILQGAIKLR